MRRPWGRCAAGWVAPLLVLVSPAAADPAAPAAQTISVLFYPAVPDEAIRYVAEVGKPTLVAVKAGADVAALLSAKCGTVPSRAALLQSMFDQNAFLKRKPIAPASGTVNLPACGWYALNAKITVTQPTSVTRLLRREMGFEGPTTIARFYQLNPGIKASADTTGIPAGTTVKLDYQVRLVSIDLKPGYAAPTVRAALDQKLAATRGAKLRTSISTEGKLVDSVSSGRLLDTDSCTAPASHRPWPFDEKALLPILAANVAQARAQRHFNPEVRLAVLDTGLLQPPVAPFLWGRLVVTPGAGGDEFGSDATTRQGDPVTPQGIQDADHGTEVAALALGGKAFVDADKTGLSAIKLRIERIATLDSGGATVISEESAAYGLNDAFRTNALIANLSVQYDLQIDLFREKLATNTTLLLIVAAGNDPNDIGQYPRWPQNYGGEATNSSAQVVTVGAVDGAQKLADFSSYSADYVDVLAPGCHVPSINLKGVITNPSGTSFAAPLTAFVAGLVKELGVTDPALIKERLTVATDVDGAFFNATWSSGILNPMKAVDLYQDLVWIKGQAGPLRGTAYFDFIPRPTCDGVPIADVSTIRKLARLNATDWLIIYRLASGGMKRCRTTIGDNVTLSFDDGSGDKDIPMATVLDVIPRARFAAP